MKQAQVWVEGKGARSKAHVSIYICLLGTCMGMSVSTADAWLPVVCMRRLGGYKEERLAICLLFKCSCGRKVRMDAQGVLVVCE